MSLKKVNIMVSAIIFMITAAYLLGYDWQPICRDCELQLEWFLINCGSPETYLLYFLNNENIFGEIALHKFALADFFSTYFFHSLNYQIKQKD